MALELHNTENPVSNAERLKINENWQRIIAGYNHLEYQIKILTGKEDVGDLIKRLEDALNDSEATLEDLQLALNDASEAIDGMVNATIEATDAATAANQATNIAVQIIADLTLLKGDLEQLQTSLEQSITDTSQATTGAINATTNANQAAQDAQQATTDATNAAQRAESAADAIEGWGQAVPYQNGTTYNRNNPVTHGGNTYQARRDGVTSTPPTNPAVDNSDWIVLAIKGVDGQGAVQTVNNQSPDQDGNVQVDIDDINGLQGALDAKANDTDLTALEQAVTTHLDKNKQYTLYNQNNKQIVPSGSAAIPLQFDVSTPINNDNSTNIDPISGRVRANVDGVFEYTISVGFPANASGTRNLSGNNSIAIMPSTSAESVVYLTLTATQIRKAGEFLLANIYQSSGASMTLLNAFLTVRKVG